MSTETFQYITPVIDEMLTRLAAAIYPLLLENKRINNIDMDQYWTIDHDDVFSQFLTLLNQCHNRSDRYFRMRNLNDFTNSFKQQYNDIAFEVNYENDDENDDSCTEEQQFSVEDLNPTAERW